MISIDVDNIMDKSKKNQLKYENCAINDTLNQNHNKIHSITTMTKKNVCHACDNDNYGNYDLYFANCILCCCICMLKWLLIMQNWCLVIVLISKVDGMDRHICRKHLNLL
jgi:hypothetical protein